MRGYTNRLFSTIPGNHTHRRKRTRRRRRPPKPRSFVWQEGIGPREIVLRVAASTGNSLNSRFYIWRIFEGARQLQQGMGEAIGLSEAAAEAIAVAVGREWIKANAPGVQVRIRSALERRQLFSETAKNRRRAA